MFDREYFADLIKEAIPPKMTITQWAEKTGVSAAHISRLRRGMLLSPPAPYILRAFAETSGERVEYTEFMVAAGYLTVDEGFSIRSRVSFETKKDLASRQEIIDSIVREALLDESDVYISTKKDYFAPDITISSQLGGTHLPVKLYWVCNRILFERDLAEIYGRIARTQLTNSCEVIIVTRDEDSHRFVCGHIPLSIQGWVKVVLMTPDRRPMKDKVLSSFEKQRV